MLKRYLRQTMYDIWSEQGKYRSWLTVEMAALNTLSKKNIIPRTAYENLKEISKNLSFNEKEIEILENESKHDVNAFLLYLSKILPEDAKWIHYGMTSSDVVDTALSLRIKQSLEIILQDIRLLALALKDKSTQYADVLCIGRTHGMHAEPMSFGLKFASFFAECMRNKDRVESALSVISVGAISGAVGNYAHIPIDVEQDICLQLGLETDPISTQIISRDRHAHVITALGILGGLLERISTEIRNLSRTEIGEVQEIFENKQMGSSAMPHKKNPILSENITGLCRLFRSFAVTSLENIALWHERDISHSSNERFVFPDIMCTCDFAIVRLTKVITNLNINRDNINKNLRSSKNIFYSQKVLLALIHNGYTRVEAYKLVQKHAMNCIQHQYDFKEALMSDKKITQSLGGKDYLNDLLCYDVFQRNTRKILARLWKKYPL